MSRGAPAAATEGTCQPSPARLSRPAPLHLPIALRSREGTPPEGQRGRRRPPTLLLAAADPPGATFTRFLSLHRDTRRCRCCRRRGLTKGAREGRRRGRRAAGTGLRAAGAGRQKENCLCSRCPFGAACPSASCPAPRASSLPPPSAAAPPPWSRAGPAVLWDPASLRGARRCWWLGL